MVRVLLTAILLCGCAPNPVAASFLGEELELQAWTMFHWTDGLQDAEGNDISVDRLALSFSETPDLCDRQRSFLQDAADQDVPLKLERDGYEAHSALFEQHFPVVDRWDVTFWFGLPDGANTVEALEVDLAPAFDDTFLNGEAIAARWDRVPPGDLLTWRSEEWYGEFGEVWSSLSGTVRLDSFAAGEGAAGSISAVFEDGEGEEAQMDVTFDVGACFATAG